MLRYFGNVINFLEIYQNGVSLKKPRYFDFMN